MGGARGAIFVEGLRGQDLLGTDRVKYMVTETMIIRL